MDDDLELNRLISVEFEALRKNIHKVPKVAKFAYNEMGGNSDNIRVIVLTYLKRFVLRRIDSTNFPGPDFLIKDKVKNLVSKMIEEGWDAIFA